MEIMKNGQRRSKSNKSERGKGKGRSRNKVIRRNGINEGTDGRGRVTGYESRGKKVETKK